MSNYFVTISCQQQSKRYVPKTELDDVVEWLTHNGVIFRDIVYENKSKSGGLVPMHIHAIVKYKGRWKPLIQYGCPSMCNYTFRIHWKPLKTYHTRYMAKQVNNPILQDQILEEDFYTYNFNPLWSCEN